MFEEPFTVKVMAPAPAVKEWVIDRRKSENEPLNDLVTAAFGSAESRVSLAVSDSVYVPAAEKPAVVSTLWAPRWSPFQDRQTSPSSR